MRRNRHPGRLAITMLAACLAAANLVQAEVVLDGSLGRTGAVAGPNYAITADLGRQLGGNLFHSFSAFSLAANEAAIFSGPDSVTSIIGRVTGGTLSSIDGKISSTIPGANFYFLNPAGIIFGANAVLDISGSIHFGAADHLGFADGARFDAANPSASTLTTAAPADFGFLGAGSSIRLENAYLTTGLDQSLNLTAGEIVLQHSGIGAYGGGGIGLKATGSLQLVESEVWVYGGLQKPPGELVIVAGQVDLNRSYLASFNDSSQAGDRIRVEATGPTAGDIILQNSIIGAYSGSIGLKATGSIQLIDSEAWVWSSLHKPPGELALVAGQVVLNRSYLTSFNDSSQPADRIRVEATDPLAGGIILQNAIIGANGGSDINLSATGNLQFVESEAWVYGGLQKPPGEISIVAGQVAFDRSYLTSYNDSTQPAARIRVEATDGGATFINGNSLLSSAYSAGSGADIEIIATDSIDFHGVGASGFGNYVGSHSYHDGAAGSLLLSGKSIFLSDGTGLRSTTEGSSPLGSSGDIRIDAQEEVRVSGTDTFGLPSAIDTESWGTGTAQSIQLTAKSLSLSGGARISSTAAGDMATAGSGGNIDIRIEGATLITGVDEINGIPSSISAQTDGAGNAGTLSLRTGSLELSDGGSIFINSFGSGHGGRLEVIASGDIKIQGVSADGLWPSGINAESFGGGSGGSVDLTGQNIEISSGGYIRSNAWGAGSGGNISIRASESVTIQGINQTAFSHVSASSGGPAASGNILVESPYLAVLNGGYIASEAEGDMTDAGSGGHIDIRTERTLLSGSSPDGLKGGISVSTEGAGAAGTLTLTTDELSILEGAHIDSTSYGVGDGGRIELNVTNQTLVSGSGGGDWPSGIWAEARGSGKAGDITLRTGSLSLVDGGLISTTSYGSNSAEGRAGDGGGIELDVTNQTLISGVGDQWPSGVWAETEGSGKAGDITLRTGSLALVDGGLISTRSYGSGHSGNIAIDAGESIVVSGNHPIAGSVSSIRTSSSGTGYAGTITLSAQNIELLRGGSINSMSLGEQGEGKGGEIFVTVRDSLTLDGVAEYAGIIGPSAITTSTQGSAAAGSIVIRAPTIEMGNGAIISSSSLGLNENAGGQGRIDIQADKLSLTGSAPDDKATRITVQTYGPGQAGDITLSAGILELRDGASISSASTGQMQNAGAGGSISITAGRIVLAGTTPGGAPSAITAASSGPGLAGDITIQADRSLTLTNDAEIATRAEQADGGNIDLKVGQTLRLSGSRIVTSVGNGQGDGGNIDIDPKFVVLDDSLIQANAYGGNGGNIRIVTDHLVASSDSRIEASSALGIAGSIEISSPNVDVGSGLGVLPTSYLDAAALLRDACAGRSADSASSLVGVGLGGLPLSPTALMTSRYDTLSVSLPALAAAAALQAQGRRHAALRTLEGLTASTGDDALAAATVRAALGQADLLTADRQNARRQLETALAEARRLDTAALESAVLNDLGLLEQIEDKPAEALASFVAARAAALRSGQSPLVARAAINAARVTGPANSDAAIAESLLAARDSLALVPDDAEKIYQLIAIGNLLRSRPASADFAQRAHQTLTAAVQSAMALDDARASAFAVGYLGELYAARGRQAEARPLLQRALFLSQLAGAPDAAYRWDWQLGRLHATVGDDGAAIAAYTRAIATLQGIRADLMADLRSVRASYRDAVGPLFLEYADLLLRHAANGPQTQRAGWLVKARATLEQLKAVELEDYFQDACVASTAGRAKELNDPPAGTAVLYPILLPDRVEMLVSLPGEIRQVRLDVDGATLGEEILAFRRLLEKRTTHQYLPLAQRLHARLIEPIGPLLAGADIHTLVFVPDGPLRGIPLAALHDGQGFLVERYAVAVVPALSLVEAAATGTTGRATLMGGITEAVQNFPALPHVAAEMQAIQTLYGGQSMRDGEFLMPRFEQALRKNVYSVVHIASHGQIENDPRKSFLLAYDGHITMDHLEGYLKFSRRKEETIDLLTLSACRTAAGDDRAALGLAGMAVKSGTRSALATLWYVSDQASSLLITEFYRQLSTTGGGKAAALRAAQKTLLADARYRHPGYWSPFLLIGNWQ